MVIKAEEAIYIVKSRILLLTGPNASITSGKNTVSGEKITLFRADGRIQVERGRDKQVEAIFYSKGKGLN
jgi:lipopolysaccharide export system protein LptA